MERLAERFDLIVPEHPGFGRSDSPAWFENIHDLAYFYLDFLEALGLARVNIVGQAIGGWIAAELAVRDTSRVRSLVLVGAPGLKGAAPEKHDIFQLSDLELAGLLFHDPRIAAAARERVAKAGSDPIAGKNRLALEKVAKEPRFHDPHLHKWLHRIDKPTLILWGAQDQAVSSTIGERYAALIPGARMERLENCGHLPHVEKADEYLSLLTRFISGEDRL
jgi:pimeloyl-ACP methyl ester carboxylesterase